MVNKPLKVGFLASGNGSSARAIGAAIAGGELDAQARLLVGKRRSTLYCSTLVGEAVVDGCGLQLDAQPIYQPLYPATLAEHAAFDEVELEWRPTA